MLPCCNGNAKGFWFGSCQGTQELPCDAVNFNAAAGMRVSTPPDTKAQLGNSAWHHCLQGNGKCSATPTEEGCSRHGAGRGGETYLFPCSPCFFIQRSCCQQPFHVRGLCSSMLMLLCLMCCCMSCDIS